MLYLGSSYLVIEIVLLWIVLSYNLWKGWTNLPYYRLPILWILLLEAGFNLLQGDLIQILYSWIIWLCMHQALRLKESSDYQKLHILSFAGVVLAAILDFQIYYGFLLLFYMLAMTTSLTLNMLYADLEHSIGGHLNKIPHQGSSTIPTDSQVDTKDRQTHVIDRDHASYLRLEKRLTRYLQSKRLIPPYFLFGIAFIAGILCISAFILFFMMPRLDGQWVQGYQRSQSTSGFSEESTLEGSGDISLSNQVAFRVKIQKIDSKTQEYLHQNPSFEVQNAQVSQKEPPIPSSELYFIGKRQHTYRQGHWYKSLFPPRKKSFYQKYWFQHQSHKNFDAPMTLWKQTYFMEPRSHQSLFTLYTPMLMEFPRYRKLEIKLSADQDIKYEQKSAIRYDLLSVQLKQSRTTASTPYKASHPLDILLDDYRILVEQKPKLQSYLQVPPALKVPLQRWTKKMIGDTRNVRMIINRLQHIFDQNYKYSLHYATPASQHQNLDPIWYFLIHSKAGHCEYFSSALALSLRTLGIPTRYVSGYRGGTWISYQGGYYRIAERDAHAWTEVWAGMPNNDEHLPHAWLTFDPTPSQSMINPQNHSQLWQTWKDSLDFFWFRYIIGFDTQDQMKALTHLNQKVDHWQYVSAQYWRKITQTLKYFLNRYYSYLWALITLFSIGLLLIMSMQAKWRSLLVNRLKTISASLKIDFIRSHYNKIRLKLRIRNIKRSMDTSSKIDHAFIQKSEQQEMLRTQADLYYLQMLDLCTHLGFTLQTHWTSELILSHIAQHHEVNQAIYQSLRQGFQHYQQTRYSANLLWEDFQQLEQHYQHLYSLVQENHSSIL
jgi:protein-glutamine gamma-glutamyltransferase